MAAVMELVGQKANWSVNCRARGAGDRKQRTDTAERPIVP